MRGRRWIVIGAVTSVLAVGAAAGVMSSQAASGGACQLSGSADFSPNGPGTADTFGYSFTGTLSNCESNSNSPASGTIAEGQVVTETVTLTNPDGTTTTGTAAYQEPVASGTGAVPGNSCAAGDTSGTSVVTWADNTTTVIDYTTQSAAAGVELTGSVVPGVTATLVPGSESVQGSTAPGTFTIPTTNTTLPVGDTANGLLTFEVTSPTDCTTATGVTSAGIDGVVGVGSLP